MNDENIQMLVKRRTELEVKKAQLEASTPLHALQMQQLKGVLGAECSDYYSTCKALEEIKRLISERETALNALKESTFDSDSDKYPKELDIAMQAWRAVAVNGQGGDGLPKERITAWITKNFPDMKKTAIERISKVCNWNKSGGG
jgi:hypothetical protein